METSQLIRLFWTIHSSIVTLIFNVLRFTENKSNLISSNLSARASIQDVEIILLDILEY